jgi:signal transduction histidine kinase
VLYLWGLRWWPGVLVGELLVNGELLLDDTSLPLGSLIGQQAGNLAEIVVGALVLVRLVGPCARLDRADQVGGMFAAVGLATAISATAGSVSMLAGGIIEPSELARFWRTWWLGDMAGALVFLPLALVWSHRPRAAWERICSWQGALLIAGVSGLSVVAVSTEQSVLYVVFPALIWAAFRFGPPGATLSIVLVAGVTIGITASEGGLFFKQPIDHGTLSTQLYVGITALTTLFLSAVVSEREQAARSLAEAREREDERALEERHRIARDLHDSIAQALFSTVLHTRTAEKSLRDDGGQPSRAIARSLSAIAELTRSAQAEIRALIFELGRDPVADGLGDAFRRHASRLQAREDLPVEVRADGGATALSHHAEKQLFGIGREALANVVKHADASMAQVSIESRPGRVLLEVRDDGRGFDPAAGHPGHFGLESMRSRAAEIDAVLTIVSATGSGTLVRVDAPVEDPVSGDAN